MSPIGFYRLAIPQNIKTDKAILIFKNTGYNLIIIRNWMAMAINK